jgi:hypothetical protein
MNIFSFKTIPQIVNIISLLKLPQLSFFVHFKTNCLILKCEYFEKKYL